MTPLCLHHAALAETMDAPVTIESKGMGSLVVRSDVALPSVALLDDHVEVVIGEAQVFSEEGARDAAGSCFAP